MKDQISPELKSATEKLVRPLNSGQQSFDANSDTWPLGKAIPKLESNIQVAGWRPYSWIVELANA